jgi:hypothetical protein
MFKIIMINKNQLKEIINDLIEICKETNLRVSDEVLLRESATYQRGMLANENRSNSSHGEKRSDFSPSIKQFKILSGMGFSKEKINQMTKLEVSKLIGEYLKNLKKENI